jgi:hypothetical protein
VVAEARLGFKIGVDGVIPSAPCTAPSASSKKRIAAF